MTLSNSKMLCLSMAAILALPSAAQSAEFLNGSFETGQNFDVPFITLDAGSTAVTGWTVLSGSIDYKGSYWQAGSGNRSIDLNGLAMGAIAQTFDTVQGTTYVVEFLLAGNPDGSPVDKTLDVFASGNAAESYSFSTDGKTRTEMGWENRSYVFTASGNTTTLTFASTTGGNYYGPTLDGVSLRTLLPVPEPGVWAMMLLGIGAVGATMRRSRRTVSFG